MTQLLSAQVEGWATEQIVSDPAVYYDSLLADIRGAEFSIELAVYIFAADAIGQSVLSALVDAARRGVSVRVLVDGVGSAQSGEQLAKELAAVNGDLRIYHPLPWYWTNYRWSLHSGKLADKCFLFLSALNRRDHRKFCVIDKSTAWCGSFNICCDHLSESVPWRDYGVRLTGHSVHSLVDNFNSIWLLQYQRITIKGLRHFRSNNSLRLRWLRNRLLVRRIRQSKQRVWICSAYFSPSSSVYRAIKTARKKGVDVTVIVAGRSDITFFPLLTSTYYADLLKLGVTVYRYKAGILHAKALLVDQQCVIGSTNLNHRSFYHDLELDVVLSAETSITKMESLLRQDIADSQQVNMADTSKLKSSFIVGWLLRAFRY